MPIISQWPVTESLPADASAIRPNAPRRSRPRRRAADRDDAAEAERPQRRQRSGTCARDVAERVAALSPYATGVGQLADADAVEHDDDDASEGVARDVDEESSAVVEHARLHGGHASCRRLARAVEPCRLGSLRNQINCRRA